MRRQEIKWSYVVIGLLAVLPFIGYAIVISYNDYRFTADIGGHMKRAADSMDAKTALQEMNETLKNMEKAGMTNGQTSLVWPTPDEDVGFWYNNMKTAKEELEKINPSTPPLEESNELIQLKGALTDPGDNGQIEITIPPGISRFPHNWGYAIWGYLSIASAIVGVISIIKGLPNC